MRSAQKRAFTKPGRGPANPFVKRKQGGGAFEKRAWRKGKTGSALYAAAGIIAAAIAILAFLGFFVLLTRWVGGGYFEEGITGYISCAAKRIALVLVLGGLLIYSYRRIGTRKDALQWVLFLAVSLFLWGYLLKDVVMDIPYLSRPESISLKAVSWRIDTGGYVYKPYKLVGLDEQGKKQKFRVNKSTYTRGKERVNTARVLYLPHTRTVMEVDGYFTKPVF